MLQAELSVVSGKQAGAVIPLPQGKFLIGREEDCQLRPNSDLVSRHHCVFTVDEYTVRLRDLGSTNGTLVNSQPVKGSVVLNPGDIVSIGKIEFRVIVKTTDSDTATGIDLSHETEMISNRPQFPAVSPGLSSFEVPQVGNSLTEHIVDPGAQTYSEMPQVGGEMPYGYQQMPGQYPQQVPGMPPGMGYPQMGYPQMMPYGYPGYPPQMYGQPMGYPQMPQGYQVQQMPQAPPAPSSPEIEQVQPKSKAAELVAALPSVRLPDPSETGAKAPTPPAPKTGGDQKTAEAKAKEEAPKMAEDIIQKYMKRRPGQ